MVSDKSSIKFGKIWWNLVKVGKTSIKVGKQC